MTGIVTRQFCSIVKEEAAGSHELRLNAGYCDRCVNDFTSKFVKGPWHKTVCHTLLRLQSFLENTHTKTDLTMESLDNRVNGRGGNI